MNVIRAMTAAAILVFTSAIALAGEQTATLKVNGMTCASCTYQVQSALKRVDGVTKAEASLETGEAVVVFDDTRTDVAALTKAATDAGFPSQVKPPQTPSAQ